MAAPLSPLDVVSVADVKAYIAVDFPDWDATISDAIKGMVNLVEQITNHRLYQRDETINQTMCKYEAFQYPIRSIVSVTDENGYDVVYKLCKGALRWTFEFTPQYEYLYAGQYPFIQPAVSEEKTIVLAVGYADITDIPDAIIFAIKKLVAEVIENRIPSKEDLPNDIATLLNPYKRFTYF